MNKTKLCASWSHSAQSASGAFATLTDRGSTLLHWQPSVNLPWGNTELWHHCGPDDVDPASLCKHKMSMLNRGDGANMAVFIRTTEGNFSKRSDSLELVRLPSNHEPTTFAGKLPKLFNSQSYFTQMV